MAALFEERYPNIAAWVQDGWIEIGHDSLDFSHFPPHPRPLPPRGRGVIVCFSKIFPLSPCGRGLG
jgi:hypothetical protein